MAFSPGGRKSEKKQHFTFFYFATSFKAAKFLTVVKFFGTCLAHFVTACLKLKRISQCALPTQPSQMRAAIYFLAFFSLALLRFAAAVGWARLKFSFFAAAFLAARRRAFLSLSLFSGFLKHSALWHCQKLKKDNLNLRKELI